MNIADPNYVWVAKAGCECLECQYARGRITIGSENTAPLRHAREMTREDLGLMPRDDFGVCFGCGSRDVWHLLGCDVLRRVLHSDAPYAFWLGADA